MRVIHGQHQSLARPTGQRLGAPALPTAALASRGRRLDRRPMRPSSSRSRQPCPALGREAGRGRR
jgi:hypothetical protein